MAEQRPFPAGLYGSSEAAFELWARVADGVDAPVERMEPALADAPADSIVRQTALTKLADRDDAELPCRPSRNRTIGSSVE
jgi:hypothetical protein